MKNFSLAVVLLCLSVLCAPAQTYNEIDETGEITQYDESSKNFNKHSKDTTQDLEIPRGLWVWTIDRRFGDRQTAEPDTMPHLFTNTIFNTGMYGEYNTTGNNYTARESRIFIDRQLPAQFMFTQPYDYVMLEPDELHFTNTLSPITNISYNNCGDKTDGEDHIDAKFAVNAGRRFGMGFDLNYAYARGYYDNQNTSHFGATFFGSYLGDKYNMHIMFSTYHQKAHENGGITDDNYVTHPESFDDSYRTDEIPTVLESNWNRNDNTHLFFTHRYNIGFYRRVQLTEDELKARKFAEESRKENEENGRSARHGSKRGEGDDGDRGGSDDDGDRKGGRPSGRPEGAMIMGDEPPRMEEGRGPRIGQDTARVISPEEQATLDSIAAAQALEDSLNATTRLEYVPVTSFIHTLDLNTYDRIYQAYETPDDYYADTYYNYTYTGNTYPEDSIYDETKFFSVKNTLAVALLEGFNKYAKAGLKVFASYEYRRAKLPEVVGEGDDAYYQLATWTENALSIGGQIVKTQGKTVHYNVLAETWLTGEDAGQLKIDFGADLNFPLFGDTVTFAAKAYFYRLNPTFYQRHYHSKHLWWDNDDMHKETRTRIEGLLSYPKTRTSLRVAVEEIQNYTYFGTTYDVSGEDVTNLSVYVNQCGSNINLLTAQLRQDFKLGVLHWENIITYQHTSDEKVLPLPKLNIFTNLYLKFRIAHELTVELGGDCYYFTKYYAPEFSPAINQFVIQENDDVRTEIGGYPYVDVYANMHLKHTRFFLMFSHVNAGNGSKEYFLTPHYPQNERIIRFGLSWNFFN